ncbi:MAG: hypothetical protein WBF42_09185 [Terracidiphilus sp.]
MASPLASPPTRFHPDLHSEARRSQQRAYLQLPAPLRLWHLASLDAPTVAIAWSLCFARAADVSLPLWVPLLLALGTWAVYIGDRLLDARPAVRSGNLDHLRERHYFHWTHRHSLISLALLAAATSTAIIFLLMPAGMRKHNSVLAAAALAYFSGIHFAGEPPRRLAPVFSKEFLVGILFTAGCAFPTLSRMQTLSDIPLFAVVAFFALLAWLNCYAIDRWESGGPSAIASSGSALALAGLSLGLICLRAASLHTAALLGLGSLSALLIVLLDAFHDRLTPVTLRAAADLVLLTPLLLLIG